jgi:hypothetical protein
MSDNVNINIQETNEIVNIVSSEIQEVIDINVFETTEDVTLNITEEIIQVNVNKVTSAEQIQSDWNQTNTDALDFIKNKPTIPEAITNTSELVNDGEDGVNPFITLEDIPAPITIDAVPTDGSTNAVSSNGVFDALANKQNSLGFTPENVANKATNLTSPDNTKYPTTQAVVDGLATKQNTLTNPVTGTGANGQVAFWNGTNSQTGDNGLFWNNTNKRLGIGTNAPTQSLELKGYILSNPTAQSGGMYFGSVAHGVRRIDGGNNVELFTAGGSLFLTGNGAGNATKVTIDQTANVLIPNGSTLANAGFTQSFIGFGKNWGTISVSAGQTIYGNQVGDTLFGNYAANGGFKFYTNVIGGAAELMRITSTGQVVIGATTAGARLDVRAQGALSTDIAFRVRNSADTANLFEVRGGGAEKVVLMPSGVIGQIEISALSIGAGGGNVIRSGNRWIFGGSTAAASAQLQIDSTTQGFLPPRMTNAQRLAIASPAVGLMVYCTDATEGLYINKSTGWQFII